MLEHEAAAIHGVAIFAPAPVRVKLFVFEAATTLLDVKVIPFVVQIHSPSTAITPDHGKVAKFHVNLHLPLLNSLSTRGVPILDKDRIKVGEKRN
jgi:hypothetical protein